MPWPGLYGSFLSNLNLWFQLYPYPTHLTVQFYQANICLTLPCALISLSLILPHPPIKNIILLYCYSFGKYLLSHWYLIFSDVSQTERVNPSPLRAPTPPFACIWIITLPSNWSFLCLVIHLDFTGGNYSFISMFPITIHIEPYSGSQDVWWINEWFLLPGFQMLWDHVSKPNMEWSCFLVFWFLFCFKCLPLWLIILALCFCLRERMIVNWSK